MLHDAYGKHESKKRKKIFTKNLKGSDLFEDLCVERKTMLNFISNK